MQQNDRFFNAYVDLAVGTIHQNVNTILELKTQVKMLEDQVRELDSAVGVMNQRIENFDKEKDLFSLRISATLLISPELRETFEIAEVTGIKMVDAIEPELVYEE